MPAPPDTPTLVDLRFDTASSCASRTSTYIDDRSYGVGIADRFRPSLEARDAVWVDGDEVIPFDD